MVRISRACRRTGARLIHVSSDAVFYGLGGVFHEGSQPFPSGVYGCSKHTGEMIVREEIDDFIILRTAHLYGQGGKNGASRMLQRLRAGQAVEADPDRLVTPTWAGLVAWRIKKLLEKEPSPGVVHAVSPLPATTWYGFASKMLECVRTGAVLPKKNTGPSPRPGMCNIVEQSVIDGVPRMPHWAAGLRQYIQTST